MNLAPEVTHSVFILEDDRALADILVRTFDSFGFKTEAFGLLKSLELRLRQKRPSLFLLDMRLPDGDLSDTSLRRLCGDGIPVILISGLRTEVADRVLGLEYGADDFLVKPFDPREAVARARAVLRRSIPSVQRKAQIAKFAGWTADFNSYTLTDPDGQPVSATTSEVRLLRTFLNAPHRVLTREALMDGDGQTSYAAFERSIDVRVSRLRQKLGDGSKNPRIIKTIKGSGYLFAVPVSWE